MPPPRPAEMFRPVRAGFRTLAVMVRGFHRFLRGRQAAWWTLAVGLAVTAGLGWELHREAVDMDRQRLALRAAELQGQLDARLEKSEMLLHNLRDYLLLSGENRETVFQRWCYENGLTINCRWIHGIAVATNRNPAAWRSELPLPPETWSTNDWETFRILARRHMLDCTIALKSELPDGKQFLDGYDLVRVGRDKDALARAIQGSRLAMSDHQFVILDASSNKVRGTLCFAPVYKPEVAEYVALPNLTRDDTCNARWMHLTSVILAPVDFTELVRSVSGEAPMDVGMELFSSTNQTARTWLNPSGDIPRAADPRFKPYLSQRRHWPMYGMEFSIFLHTTPLFEAQSPRRLARIAVAAGTLLTLLATTLVGVAVRARSLQESLTEQIREARDALAVAQKERNRVSRDLHDGTIQSLYAIQLGLGHTVRKIEADPRRAGRELSAVRTELDNVIAEIRQYISADLAAVRGVDFGAVLQALVQRAQAGATARITLVCEPAAADRLLPVQEVHVANITREALSNSLRHGQPRAVHIALRAEADAVVLEISDDGAGFDPAAPRRTGVGLASMMSRAREAGGHFDIQSRPGQGTRIVVRIPAASRDSGPAGDADEMEEEPCPPAT